MTEPWRPLAAALADKLVQSGELRDPRWRDAFAATPRHVFVPGHPLEVAYSPEAIVTQTRPAYALGGASVDLPTSSASAPGAVANMLEALRIRDGHRVLEIGTGTGFNAALLCHRLGADNVYSIDIDPELVSAAQGVLAGLGHTPILRAGDGRDGMPEGAPYDAIIATCAVNHVPPAWIRQLDPGGIVVAPLTGNEAALMVLTKTAVDEVVGRLDNRHASFMPMRTDLDNPLATPYLLGAATLAMPHYGTTSTDPAALLDIASDLALFLHLHVTGLAIGVASDDPELGKTIAVGDPTSVAQAVLEPAGPHTWTVLQRGARRLWDTIEHALERWEALHHPGRERFGITALDRADRQYVWLDDPDGPYSWPMPL